MCLPGASRMPGRKEFGHCTQVFSTTGDSRTDRADRGIYERCGLLVRHALQPDEQNHRALLLWQLDDCALQVAKFEPYGLIGRDRQTGMRMSQFQAGAVPRISPRAADMLVMHDGEEPGSKIGARFPQMDFPQGARETILNEIVCRYPVAGQSPRVARQARDQDLD